VTTVGVAALVDPVSTGTTTAEPGGLDAGGAVTAVAAAASATATTEVTGVARR
jgi:hypothetical protein